MLINFEADVANKPTIKNGEASPKEYEKSKTKAEPGAVAAKPKIAPRTAPTQGVHPTAKAAPKTKAVKYFDLNIP